MILNAGALPRVQKNALFPARKCPSGSISPKSRSGSSQETSSLPRMGMDSDVEEGNLDNYIHFLRRRLKSVEKHTGSQKPYAG